MNDDGRVLIGDVVVGVAEGAWPLDDEVGPLGAAEENNSQAETTNRL